MSKNFLAVVLIATSFLLTFYWTKPMFEEGQDLVAKKGELNSTLLRFQELKRVRDDLLGKYNSVSQSDLRRLEELLPPSPKTGLLIANLENLSRRDGVLLKKIDIIKTEPSAGLNPGASVRDFRPMPFTISFSSSYSTFRSFLNSLESSRRLIDVNSISFVAGETDSYEFLLSAVTYWQER